MLDTGQDHLTAGEVSQALSAFHEGAILCPHDDTFFALIIAALDLLGLGSEIFLLSEMLLTRLSICEPTLPRTVAPAVIAAAYRGIGLVHATHGSFDDANEFFHAAISAHDTPFNHHYLAAAQRAAHAQGGDRACPPNLAVLAPLRAMRPYPLHVQAAPSAAYPSAAEYGHVRTTLVGDSSARH